MICPQTRTNEGRYSWYVAATGHGRTGCHHENTPNASRVKFPEPDSKEEIFGNVPPIPTITRTVERTREGTNMSKVIERLKQLGHQLPTAPKPVAAYVPAVRS